LTDLNFVSLFNTNTLLKKDLIKQIYTKLNYSFKT